jgi:hypothetical protein
VYVKGLKSGFWDKKKKKDKQNLCDRLIKECHYRQREAESQG